MSERDNPAATRRRLAAAAAALAADPENEELAAQVARLSMALEVLEFHATLHRLAYRGRLLSDAWERQN